MSIKDYLGNMKALLVKVHDLELKSELLALLLDAQGEALDLQERLAKLQEENAGLNAERNARDDVEAVRDQLFYARHAYWRKDETIDSAYCAACWDTKGSLVRLMRIVNQAGFCHSCKSRHHHVYQGPRPSEGDEATPRARSIKLSSRTSTTQRRPVR